MRRAVVALSIAVFAVGCTAKSNKSATSSNSTTTILTVPTSPTTAVAAGASSGTSATVTPPAGLKVLKNGFSVLAPKTGGPVVTYAAVVSNPNSVAAAEGTDIVFNFFEKSGQVAGSQQFVVGLILPGQTIAAAGSAPIQGVASVQVETLVQQWVTETNQEGAFTLSPVTLSPLNPGIRVSALLSSSFPTNITEVKVVSVVENAAGSVLGGSSVTLSLVPRGGKLGVAVDIPDDIPGAAQGALYPAFTSLTQKT